ncbi:hypothetical protein UMM65_13930 [Aureibaculum sp. 2210JD6-5]|uniref:hypothetical protein n=1 Tax=Aureibaculum sp. 2210JD6-5 TaxID=3103957 RepID=UPI002AAE2E6B|nr:hypothetical protein [Aureibaculum sp. 2210JD6-5]MDY7396345.1 hypothetical protein [Aureibaculum sp. 2210JD6-5]
MEKFKNREVATTVLFIFFLGGFVYAQQKESLRVRLWQRVLSEDDLKGNDVQDFLDNKGWQEWEEWVDTMNSNVVIDDTEKGYLQINRFYQQTTAGAYKEKNGNHTILQNTKFRHFNRGISSNKNLVGVLPKNFGITDFISDTTHVEPSFYSVFYIVADIPRTGTDTQVTIKLIPFGMFHKGNLLTYKIKEYNNENNIFLYGFKHEVIDKLNDEQTLTYLKDRQFDTISEKDKEVVDQFIAEDGQFNTMEDLSKLMVHLNKVYKLYFAINYKSIVLGWNREEGRFFIKDQIKNDKEELSFKEFLENAEYYMAIQ